MRNYFFAFVISYCYLLSIIYLILIIVQSFKNIKYNNFSTLEIIKERILYEQTSYEIYNSIKSTILLDLKIQTNCEKNYQPIDFMLKINPNYNFKSTIKINHLFNKQFCIPKYEKFRHKYISSKLKYEELIKHSVKIKNKENYNNTSIGNNIQDSFDNICEKEYKPCGILDTKNNILCFPKKYNCPLNDLQISFNNNTNLLNNGFSEERLENNISIYLNYQKNIDRPIITTIFLSFDNPWNHEWEELISSKIKDKEEKNKRENFPFSNYDKYMINSPFPKLSLISLKDILIWEKNNEKLEKMVEEIKPSQFYYLFHKNYIGFENHEELIKFKKYFNTNNYRDNPLYKLSKTLNPYLASIIIAFILIVYYVIDYLYCLYKEFKDEGWSGFFIFLSYFFSLIYFIVYFSLYFSDRVIFKKLEFNFDEQIQEVFDLYKKRNKQPIYLAAVIILLFSCIPHFIVIFIILISLINNLIKAIRRDCGFCGLC